MKRIKIFISSVQSEFSEERAMLSQYIRTDALLGKFFETFLFEDVPANEASPQQVYLNEVEMRGGAWTRSIGIRKNRH